MKPPSAIHCRIAATVLASGLALVAASAGAQQSTAQTLQTPQAWSQPDLDLSNEAIQPLRQAAQVGDVDAALVVATRLVDRYEHNDTSDDLFEAMIWIDRYQGNETFANSGLLARVQQRDCRHPVMRLHRLCDVAE